MEGKNNLLEKEAESPKKKLKTITKLQMQLDGNKKKVAKKKRTKTTAITIVSENIESTNILKGANILLKDKNTKKKKKKETTEKTYVHIILIIQKMFPVEVYLY